MRTVIFAMCAAAAAVTAGGPGTAAPVPKHLQKGDPALEQLQGEWKLTDVAVGGTSLGAEVPGQLGVTAEFRGGTLIITSRKQRSVAAVKLDSSARPPRLTTADVVITNLEGERVRDERAEQPCAMIYKVDGDTLALASRGDRDKYPSNFGSADQRDVMAMTFTRVKK